MYEQQKRMERYMATGMESCVVRSILSGGAGLALGGFITMMTMSFAYEDPLLRAQEQAGLNTRQKTAVFFKEMGKNMWRSGKGFGKVGGLYAGIECAIEGYRARNDMTNPLAAGFVTGAILARNSGPRAAVLGGFGFAAFSGAIDLYLRRELPDDD